MLSILMVVCHKLWPDRWYSSRARIWLVYFFSTLYNGRLCYKTCQFTKPNTARRSRNKTGWESLGMSLIQELTKGEYLVYTSTSRSKTTQPGFPGFALHELWLWHHIIIKASILVTSILLCLTLGYIHHFLWTWTIGDWGQSDGITSISQTLASITINLDAKTGLHLCISAGLIHLNPANELLLYGSHTQFPIVWFSFNYNVHV